MQTINIDIDQEDGNVSVDIVGAHGASCAETQKAFAKLGKLTESKKKPEYHEKPIKNKISSGR